MDMFAKDGISMFIEFTNRLQIYIHFEATLASRLSKLMFSCHYSFKYKWRERDRYRIANQNKTQTLIWKINGSTKITNQTTIILQQHQYIIRLMLSSNPAQLFLFVKASIHEYATLTASVFSELSQCEELLLQRLFRLLVITITSDECHHRLQTQ